MSYRSAADKYVAIKFQKSARHYTEAAYDEVELLTVVRRRSENPGWKHHLEDLRVNNVSREHHKGYNND